LKYNKTYKAYIDYIEKCKKIIKSTFFNEEDAVGLNIKNNELGIAEIVRKHRLKMIDIKLEHTLRMIEQVISINENLGIELDLGLIIKTAVLYHDIGRFRQSTWSNTFGDSIYKQKGSKFNNHSEDGYDIFINNDFNIDSKYVPVIGKTIYYHQDYLIEPRLNYRYEDNLSNLKVDDIITGKYELNTAEWQIASLIVQLVADVDKTDILYQHLSQDFEMIREYIYDNSLDSLDNIAIKWEISKNEIIEYNKIDEKKYLPRKIMIPIKNVPIEKLIIPEYMKKMFYDNSWPPLKELVTDNNWNFITILWWRLSHFLNAISFTSTLINIHENKLLEDIYNKIPDKIKPLVKEAFEYSKEVLVENKINKNKGNIYLKKK